MIRSCVIGWVMTIALQAEADDHAEPRSWRDGDHLTGDWAGRAALADRGVTLDVLYAADLFTAHSHATLLGHLDAALTLDTHKLGWWDGGLMFVLAQNSEGTGINSQVGSTQPVTNLEADEYTQVTELFFEQALLDDKLRIRVGKQDANRDFGTPRFGGNFINNNFGMFPNSPLPSYPTTGLGAVVNARPIGWLTAKVAIYEGSPMVGGLNLDTAFREGAGYTLVTGVAATRTFGPDARDGGTTSFGVWDQAGAFTQVGVPDPRVFDRNDGWFVQHDERIYTHPGDPSDGRGLNVILRFSWARADRNETARYAGGSVAWHGVGTRRDDTIGLGVGYFTIAEPVGGSPGPSDELFFETFYKARFTSFVSLQPDLQFYRHAGGDGRDAVLVGARLKVKL